MPNPEDPCEQERLRKDPSGWSEYINVQQRYSLLNKKLKVIESMDNLESVDPKELSLVPDLVIPPSSKCQHLKSTMESNAPRSI